MKIKPFGVEIWMNQYETQCAYNLAETCVESLTVAQLLDLAGKRDVILEELLPLKLTYGAIEGTDRLRGNVAALYARQKADNVTITHGAIGANALVYATLVEPGDRVISVLPTYQQHYSIPESLGADVQVHKLREENGFLPDLDEIARLITPNTKLIALTNPNNPTGSLMDRAMMQRIADLVDAAIDLVAQHVGADAGGHVGDALHNRAVHQRAGRVVRVGEGDQLGLGRDQPRDLVEVGQEAVLLAQLVYLHIRAEALGDRIVLLIGRQHRDDAIAGLDQGCVGQRVRADRAMGDGDVLRLLPGI